MRHSPADACDQRSTTMASEVTSSDHKGHVFVIDDEEDQRVLLAMTLERAGYRVTSLASPREALELLVTEDVDVVLTDIFMPEMTGEALCERVHGSRPGVPVVFVTGQATFAVAVDAVRVGVFDFVVKPVAVDLLLIVIARAVAERRL